METAINLTLQVVGFLLSLALLVYVVYDFFVARKREQRQWSRWIQNRIAADEAADRSRAGTNTGP